MVRTVYEHHPLCLCSQYATNGNIRGHKYRRSMLRKGYAFTAISWLPQQKKRSKICHLAWHNAPCCVPSVAAIVLPPLRWPQSSSCLFCRYGECWVCSCFHDPTNSGTDNRITCVCDLLACIYTCDLSAFPIKNTDHYCFRVYWSLQLNSNRSGSL